MEIVERDRKVYVYKNIEYTSKESAVFFKYKELLDCKIQTTLTRGKKLPSSEDILEDYEGFRNILNKYKQELDKCK